MLSIFQAASLASPVSKFSRPVFAETAETHNLFGAGNIL
ncbi:hypothetical protein NBRC3257_1530 [Gluconobacter thailandicus NBRC 3257]|uniref:Uncharacterized protein n=1 Tax=Gluconobacter thailandicus NBRC 3257 TaxID=1381097 RepID=A0ABQ0IWF4_GLUTH|nr:hypothetical protein B932_0966 [Gluconobacter oxydans H24]GAC89099.1 hypothetical protein NBRC3255_2760 [Gluconobacter thailandicus NBRC 3255]GAD26531.1 hypothetical protein NBRC3257_1530 [Gluconobacter thailandicus NBRC 3257]